MQDIREQHTRDSRHLFDIFYPVILPHQAHASSTSTKPIYRDILYFLQPHQQQRDLLLFMKYRSLVKSIWVKNEKNHILIARNHLKSWKIIFSFVTKLPKWYCDINQYYLKETLNTNIKLWLSIWNIKFEYKNLNANMKT